MPTLRNGRKSLQAACGILAALASTVVFAQQPVLKLLREEAYEG
jgi:hypothetical protein